MSTKADVRRVHEEYSTVQLNSEETDFRGPGAESRAREYAAWKYPVVVPVVDESEALDPELATCALAR